MIEKIKNMPNPYMPIHDIDEWEFVGREKYIDLLRKKLDEYNQTGKISNIIITGNKSIGKSTLLKKYKKILEDNNYAVYETEILRDDKYDVDEFEFFKDIFDYYFSKYGRDGTFFDQRQVQMWYDLTMDKYESEVEWLDRKLLFPSKYANKKKGKDEVLNYKHIENDFNTLINELTSEKMGFHGVALIIDEIQELKRNSLIIDYLRKLSESLYGVIIIAAGLPTFMGDEMFEKFINISIPIDLQQFNYSDSISLITRPLENRAKVPKNDALNLFEFQTIHEIVENSMGNPLHIRMICSKLFDEFKNDAESKNMYLNRNVMDRVMEHYSNTRKRSKIIKASLESCTREQLDKFSRLYEYEGLNIKSIILLKNAFNSLQSDVIEEIRKSIIDDLLTIYDLGLFVFKPNIIISDLGDTSVNELSQYKYEFIGDPIDKLYTMYYYHDLTGKILDYNDNKNFENLLANKLSREIEASIDKTNIAIECLDDKYNPIRIHDDSDDIYNDPTKIVDEFDKLQKLNPDKIDDESQKFIKKLHDKYDIKFISFLSSFFEYEGYYLLLTNATIRGKKKIIFNYFPVKSGTKDIKTIREKIYDNRNIITSSIDEYSININWMYLYYIPIQPFYILFYVDVTDEYKKLHDYFDNHKYDKAVEKADAIYRLDIKLREGGVAVNVDHYNNYGFCLINVDSIDRAEEIFEDNRRHYLLSEVNLSYIHFINNRIDDAKSILKRIQRKKIGLDVKASYLHIFIKHNELENKDKVVKDILPYNIACWNLALIEAQTSTDDTIVNSYLKKVNTMEKDAVPSIRVRYWIEYYYNNINKSLNMANNVLKRLNEKDFMHPLISNDIKLFEKEL